MPEEEAHLLLSRQKEGELCQADMVSESMSLQDQKVAPSY